MKNTVKTNLLQIQDNIAPLKPNIIAVTKYFDNSAIIAAYNAGIRDFAEARINDAISKIESLPQDIRENSKFHFIGHLQSNKVAKVVRYFDFIHSVDSLHIAQKISAEVVKINKIQKIFLEVNFQNEEQKFGFSLDTLESEFLEIQKLKNIQVLGLMSMSPLGADKDFLTELFTKVRDVQNALNEQYDVSMKELSMGMSQDYAIAARCGATMLRIGRKLFS